MICPSAFQEKLMAEQAQQAGRGPVLLASGLHFLPNAQPRACTGRWCTAGPCQTWMTPWALWTSSGGFSTLRTQVLMCSEGAGSHFGHACEKAVLYSKEEYTYRDGLPGLESWLTHTYRGTSLLSHFIYLCHKFFYNELELIIEPTS